MASVTFPVNIGGDGSTVSDDSNVSTGLANGGHRTRFVPALGQVVAIGNFIVPVAQNALLSPGTSATSTSSVTIGTGSKSLTLAQTGKAFAVGQWVQVTDLAAPSVNYMVGAITAFNAGTGAMTVTVAMAGGSGTLSSWAVHPASPMSLAVTLGSDGSLLLTGAGALGYGAGAGGTVTQITSKTTTVILNKPTGRITTHNASLASGASVVFQLTNSYIGASDVVQAVISDAGIGQNYELYCVGVTAGLALMRLKNIQVGPLSDAVPINFSILRGSIT